MEGCKHCGMSVLGWSYENRCISVGAKKEEERIEGRNLAVWRRKCQITYLIKIAVHHKEDPNKVENEKCPFLKSL